MVVVAVKERVMWDESVKPLTVPIEIPPAAPTPETAMALPTSDAVKKAVDEESTLDEDDIEPSANRRASPLAP